METKHRGNIVIGLAGLLGLATAVYSAPAHAACQSSFSRSKSTSHSLGDYNKLWGNVYGNAFIKGRDYSSGDRIDASAQATADVRIFGVRRQVVKAIGSAYSYYGNSTGGSIDVYVLGVNNFHRSWSYPLTTTWSRDKTFFSASQWFFPGGIPVHVTETATGELGIQVSGGPTTTGIAADVRPWARTYATGSASVDVLVAAFGVTAEVDLASLEYPTRADLRLSGNRLSWTMRVDRVLSTLNGRAWVWVKAFFGAVTHEQDIISWNGFSQTTNLYNYSSSTDLCN